MSKPSDKFKPGGWVRVMPTPPTEKQLLRVPHGKRRGYGWTDPPDYSAMAGGIYQIIDVSDGDFTVCLNVDGYERWFAPDWLITIEDPERIKEQDARFKEGLKQIKAADTRRDEIFKHMFTPWWATKEKKK